MSRITALTRLERAIVPRAQAEQSLLEMLELGVFVALLAPLRCGRSTLLRALKERLEGMRGDGLFVLLRPDQSPDLPREVFLHDLLSKLRGQLDARGIPPLPALSDPYLTLKDWLTRLPTCVEGPVVVAVDDLRRVELRHLRTLLWVLREIHSQRADEGWSGPLSRLAVVVAGSRLLYELTIGQEDQTLSPYNVAELYFLPSWSTAELSALIQMLEHHHLLHIGDFDQTLAEISSWAGGHPALYKGLLAELIGTDTLANPRTVAEAGARAALTDRTLLASWERLEGEALALDYARELVMEGARFPANLELAPDALRTLYWLGFVTEQEGTFAPRCRMAETFLRTHFEAAARAAARHAVSLESREPVSTGRSALPPTPTDPATTVAPRFARSAFPESLLEAFSGGEGVLFIGAGASRAAGLPTWAELCRAMVDRLIAGARDELERMHLQSYLEGGDALATAQLLHERLGPHDYHRFLAGLLRKPVPLGPLHQALARIPTRLILTTNFDKLLEKTFRLPEGDDPPVVVSTPQLAAIASDRGPLIVKLHGDIDHPETIVLTSDDYLGYFERHTALRRFLEYQLCHRTVLFLGFGLKDPNFDLIFEEARRTLQGGGRPAYSLMVGVNPFEIDRWRARGIHILTVPDFEDIPDWMDSLGRHTTP